MILPENRLFLAILRDHVTNIPGAGDVERILVKALLSRFLLVVVIGAQIHLKTAVMVGGEFNFHVNKLANAVVARDDPFGEESASLVRSRFLQVVGVTAKTTFTLILLPLDYINQRKVSRTKIW